MKIAARKLLKISNFPNLVFFMNVVSPLVTHGESKWAFVTRWETKRFEQNRYNHQSGDISNQKHSNKFHNEICTAQLPKSILTFCCG